MRLTTRWSWATACALLACGEARREPPAPRRQVVLATFTADVDAATGAFTLRAGPPTAAQAIVELPWERDGEPGTGSPDTVELVTETFSGAVADGCAPGVGSYEATVRLRSFYATSLVQDAHVEITGMTATGFEACDSAFPAPAPDVTRDFGLFPYGTLTRAGMAGDSALASWKFRYPSATSFTMWGHVLGEVVPCVPPKVVAAAQDGGRVTVTFDEPMATAPTAAAISVTEAGRPVAGSVSVSERGHVFTFTPSARFRAGVVYTLEVARTAADQLGAGLASPYSAMFSTEPQLSGPGSGLLQPLALAYDRDGNGLLLWGATQAAPLYYAYYSAATGTWGDPVLLDARGHGARVAASTTQLAALWKSSAGLHVAIFTNGIPGAKTVLQSSLLGADQAIASNGRGFAAVWAGTGGAFAAIWDGVDWSPSTSVAPDTSATGIAVGSDGVGYRAVWITGSGSSCSVTSATYAGGAWSRASLGSSSTGVSPALAVTPTTTCIAWRGYGAFGATLRVERGGTATTTTGFYGPYSWSSLSAAAIGDRCQVAAAGSDGVYGASNDGASWTTTGASLGFGTSAASPAVVPLGTGGFAVVAQAGSHVQVNRTTGWSFGGPAAQVDTGTEAARSAIAARAGGAAEVVFSKADAAGERMRIARVDAAGVGAPRTLSMPPPEGQAARVQVAANASGDLVAVWEQQDAGGWNAFWAYRAGGTWSAPGLVAAGGREPVVASNGTEFMVAWRTALPGGTSQLSSRRLAAGAWLAGAVSLTSGSLDRLALASDGAGWALSYHDGVGPYGVLHANGAWLTPQQLDPGAVRLATSEARVAGRTGEYLFVWVDDGIAYQRRAAWSGSAWAWGPATAIAGTSTYVPPALAAGPGGFAVVSLAGASPYPIEARLVTGGAAGAPTVLRARGSGCAYAVASNGTTYLAASGCQGTSDALESRVWDGAQWQPARTMRAGAYVLALAAASDGAGYAVLADSWPSHGGLWAVTAPEPSSGAFSTSAVGPGSGDGEHGALAGSAGGFVVAWKALDPYAAVSRILSADL